MKVFRHVLDHGLVLLVVERRDTPLVAVRAFVDAGQTVEAKPGLSWLCGRTLAAGAGERDEIALVEAVEAAGASLAVSGEGLAIKATADKLGFALDLAADLLVRPRFSEDAVAREREVGAAELIADLDRPRRVVYRAFLELVYGAHPFARDPRGSPHALRGLSRDDVVAHHASNFASARTKLAVVGDVEPRDVLREVSRRFPAVPGARGAGAPPAPPPPAPRERRIVDPGAHQVQLYLGHLGVRRADPDWAALRVLDQVLGAGTGFTDRISRRVRDELGLAYTVGADLCGTAGAEPGVFRAYVGTSPGHWERARDEIVGIVRGICEAPAGEDEVAAARLYLEGAHVFETLTAEDVAAAVIEMERHALGFDAPDRYLAELAAVTPAHLLQAARRHLHPNALSVVYSVPRPTP